MYLRVFLSGGCVLFFFVSVRCFWLKSRLNSNVFVCSNSSVGGCFKYEGGCNGTGTVFEIRRTTCLHALSSFISRFVKSARLFCDVQAGSVAVAAAVENVIGLENGCLVGFVGDCDIFAPVVGALLSTHATGGGGDARLLLDVFSFVCVTQVSRALVVVTSSLSPSEPPAKLLRLRFGNCVKIGSGSGGGGGPAASSSSSCSFVDFVAVGEGGALVVVTVGFASAEADFCFTTPLSGFSVQLMSPVAASWWLFLDQATVCRLVCLGTRRFIADEDASFASNSEVAIARPFGDAADADVISASADRAIAAHFPHPTFCARAEFDSLMPTPKPTRTPASDRKVTLCAIFVSSSGRNVRVLLSAICDFGTRQTRSADGSSGSATRADSKPI